ncbi:MAG: DUF3108 domain-containing protein [Candidatus Woesearchaeota archaeon]
MKRTCNVRVIFFVIFLSWIVYISNLRAESFVVYPGEELFYEVDFLGIKLGSIKIVTEGIENYEGKEVYKAKAYIDSYKGIPFVDLHTIYQSWFDKSVSFSYKFVSNSKQEDNSWDYQEIKPDYKNNSFRLKKYLKNNCYFDETFELKQKANDGLSLFFLARKYTKLNRTVTIQTIMDKNVDPTILTFRSKIENSTISAISYPIRTIYFNGEAKWKGVYGLSGYFEGWFSDDEARVPIKAKMNVYVGNINIELKSWVRPGWTPPKG